MAGPSGVSQNAPQVTYPPVPLPPDILPGGSQRIDGTQPAGTQPPPGGTQQTGGPLPPAVQGAAAAPNLPQTRAAANQGQAVRNTGLFGCVKAGLANFAKAIRNLFSSQSSQTQPLNIPPSINVQCAGLPNGATSVTIDKSQYEQMIMAMPKSERANALAQLPNTLGTRISTGIRLLNDVRAGNPPAGRPSAQDVSNLMLGLYALAAAKGEPFTNGSFQVLDPQGRLSDWLDTSTEVYLRSSSHLKAYQDAQIPNPGGNGSHVNMQRGIDVPEGVTGLPNGHKTLVYGTVPGIGTPPTPRRIFLKTESAGCRISTINLQDNSGALSSPNMHIRGIRLSDIPEAIRHGLSFLQTRGQQGNTAARKEHFPKPIADAYKDTLAQLTALSKQPGNVGEAASAALTELQKGSPSHGGGVCMLRKNMGDAMAAASRANAPALTTPAAIKDLLDPVRGSLSLALANPRNMPQDHADIRLGNEVIID